MHPKSFELLDQSLLADQLTAPCFFINTHLPSCPLSVVGTERVASPAALCCRFAEAAAAEAASKQEAAQVQATAVQTAASKVAQVAEEHERAKQVVLANGELPSGLATVSSLPYPVPTARHCIRFWACCGPWESVLVTWLA